MNRVVALEGCLNFRDLGGYATEDGRTVRWQQVFRSDALHHLTRADIRTIRERLGLRTVIDLRSTAEVRAAEAGLLTSEPLTFHHMPLYDGKRVSTEDERAAAAGAASLADRYFLLAEYARAPIARTITAIAQSDGPVVYHCAAGKDRTGIISAILLGLLGVREEIIVADYAATRENLDAIIDRLMATEGYQTIFAALPPSTLHAEPETMISFLARIRDEYGSVRGYAGAAGVSDAAIETLAARLLSE
jgi:protein-tyrosine phosphatase